jgi:hypothetical protein
VADNPLRVSNCNRITEREFLRGHALDAHGFAVNNHPFRFVVAVDVH